MYEPSPLWLGTLQNRFIPHTRTRKGNKKTPSLSQPHLLRIPSHRTQPGVFIDSWGSLVASQKGRTTHWGLLARPKGQISQQTDSLSHSPQLFSDPGKKGNPFWGRPFLVGQPPKKWKKGATEQLIISTTNQQTPRSSSREARIRVPILFCSPF